jgi:hypothetical protein
MVATSLGCVLLDKAIVLMSKSKVHLEVGPGVFDDRPTAPFATSIRKDTRVEEQSVGGVDLLGTRDGYASGGGKIDRVVYLFDKGFKGRVMIPRFLEAGEVFFEIMRCDSAVDA